MPVVKAKETPVSQSQSQSAPRVDEKLMPPGEYEVTPDSVFKVLIPLRKKKGEKWWAVCPESEAEVTEEVTFRMWTYDEMVELRKLAMTYDQVRRVHMIDHDLLNRYKIQRLMVGWSFAKGNPRLGIHHVNGVLTDESWKAVTKLQANILRFVFEGMNERYEFGG
jgi:hypothetical protein